MNEYMYACVYVCIHAELGEDHSNLEKVLQTVSFMTL